MTYCFQAAGFVYGDFELEHIIIEGNASVYLWPCQKYDEAFFENSFAKSSVIDLWQGSKYTSVIDILFGWCFCGINYIWLLDWKNLQTVRLLLEAVI